MFVFGLGDVLFIVGLLAIGAFYLFALLRSHAIERRMERVRARRDRGES